MSDELWVSADESRFQQLRLRRERFHKIREDRLTAVVNSLALVHEDNRALLRMTLISHAAELCAALEPYIVRPSCKTSAGD